MPCLLMPWQLKEPIARHQQAYYWPHKLEYSISSMRRVNSLAPGRFQFNIRKVIFKLTLVNGGWCISYEIALRLMPQDLTDKSTLVQVMAWCRQATSHFLSQWWPRSLSLYGVIRPQWVNFIISLCNIIWLWNLTGASADAEAHVKFQNDMIIQAINVTDSNLSKILKWDFISDITTGPWHL